MWPILQTNISKTTSNTHDRIGIQRSRLTVVSLQEAVSVMVLNTSASTPLFNRKHRRVML